MAAVDRTANAPAGFVRLRVTFPERPPTPREPLVEIGDAVSGAVIFVHYVDDTGQIAFGSSFRGERSPAGDPTTVDLARAHDVAVRWLPVDDARHRRLEVRLDGMIVYHREIAWPERDGAVVAGRNLHAEPGCAPSFTGKLHSVQRSADGRDPLLGRGGVVKMRVLLPRVRPGTFDPLLVTGRHGGGDILLVEYVDAQSVRFALDHWGSALLRSEPVRLDPALPQEIEISLTSLVPPTEFALAPHQHRGRVEVRVAGTSVWDVQTYLFTVPAEEVYVGRNSIGGSNGGPTFTGDILAVERVARE